MCPVRKRQDSPHARRRPPEASLRARQTLFDANSLCFVYRPTAYVDFQLTHMPHQAYILVKPKNRPGRGTQNCLRYHYVEFDQFSNNTSPMTIL